MIHSFNLLVSIFVDWAKDEIRKELSQVSSHRTFSILISVIFNTQNSGRKSFELYQKFRMQYNFSHIYGHEYSYLIIYLNLIIYTIVNVFYTYLNCDKIENFPRPIHPHQERERERERGSKRVSVSE